MHRFPLLLLTPLVVASVSCRSPQVAPEPNPVASGMRRVVHGDSAAIARARADSVRHPYTAADVEFMTMMIAHHAQALEMARMAPTHGAGAEVQRLAARILNGQRDEIVSMQQWLADRRQPVPLSASHAGSTSAAGMAHAHHMPGMLTADQMRALDAARGLEFDRLFLRFMIQHHRGAVTMVQQLFATPGAGENETVFRLASDVNVDQITEIARMETMLAALQP